MTSFPFLSPGSTIRRKMTTVSLIELQGLVKVCPSKTLTDWFLNLSWLGVSLLGHYHPKSFSWMGKMTNNSFFPLLTSAQPLLITEETEPFCLSFQFFVHFKENVLSIVIYSFIQVCTKDAYYESGSVLGSVIYPYTKCILLQKCCPCGAQIY